MAIKKLVLIINDVRSAYNVGAIFRSADAFNVSEIILCGVTPYPKAQNDKRLPHVRDKAHKMISKTALGAEATVKFRHMQINQAIAYFKDKDFEITALEQSPNSIPLTEHQPKGSLTLIVGSEVGGLPKSVLDEADNLVEIPMMGRKESLNVAVAAGVALFHYHRFLAK